MVHLPGGVPKKGVNKEYKDFFPKLSLKLRVLKLRFLAFVGGPGGFRELREAGRNHFHLSWYLSVLGIRSYGQKPLGWSPPPMGFYLRILTKWATSQSHDAHLYNASAWHRSPSGFVDVSYPSSGKTQRRRVRATRGTCDDIAFLASAEAAQKKEKGHTVVCKKCPPGFLAVTRDPGH